MTLRVKLSIEPNGDAERARDVGEIEIVNITRSSLRISSDYAWRLKCTVHDRTTAAACGYLVDSYNGDAMQLVHEVLTEWRSGRQLPMDNHGQMGLPEGVPISAAELWERLDKQASDHAA